MAENHRRSEIAGRRLRGTEAAARYAERTLLPALGAPGARFQLAVPREGVRSLVFFVTIEPSRRLVMRCVPRRGDARWLAAAVDTFAARSLPAPRPVYRDLSLWTRWTRGWSVFVEDLVEGEPASDSMPRESLIGMGRAYARVHSVTSDGWDRPHRPRGGDMLAEWAMWAERLGNVAARASRKARPDLARELDDRGRWLHEHRPESMRAYSLCHNRVTPSNVVIRPDGSCVLIDLERVKFGSHLHELALLRREVLGGSVARFEAFLIGYREVAPASCLPESAPQAWEWHSRLVALKRAHDAARAGDFEGVHSEISGD